MSEQQWAEAHERALAEAQALAQRVCSLLHSMGWDCAVVQIGRVVHAGGRMGSVGAATYAANPLIGPGLPQEARTLRALADQLEDEFRKLNCPEAIEAWHENREPTP